MGSPLHRPFVLPGSLSMQQLTDSHLAWSKLYEAEVKSPARSGANLAKLVNGSVFANGRAPSPYGKPDDVDDRRRVPVLLRRESQQTLRAPVMLSSL
jgi:hypothetical protein